MKTLRLSLLPAAVVSVFLFSQCVSFLPAADRPFEKEKLPAEKEKKEVPLLKSESSGFSAFSPHAVSVVARTHASSDTPGGRVLNSAVEMVDGKDLVLGSCWGYVNSVYEKAGLSKEKRGEIYKEKSSGPYADPSIITPGDWVMYCNLPYGGHGHSAIFVEWIDVERRSAITIEYVGNNRKIPGRYREADITNTYCIIRGTE
ncbi:MAG: hypothetical protein JW881_20915 [Spirochaetales bacterium]|nr:hypothetical protein [Spirochaetales bacterium]